MIERSPERVLSGAGREVERVLERHLSAPNRRALLEFAARQSALELETIRRADVPKLVSAIVPGLRMFAKDGYLIERELAELLPTLGVETSDSELRIPIEVENDVVRARGAMRELCHEANVGNVLTTKLVTVVSELARNVYQYAGRGHVGLRLSKSPRPGLHIEAVDDGPGIADLDAILLGRYRSKTGMGAGLRGSKRLVDDFRIETGPGRGTQVFATKWLA